MNNKYDLTLLEKNMLKKKVTKNSIFFLIIFTIPYFILFSLNFSHLIIMQIIKYVILLIVSYYYFILLKRIFINFSYIFKDQIKKVESDFIIQDKHTETFTSIDSLDTISYIFDLNEIGTNQKISLKVVKEDYKSIQTKEIINLTYFNKINIVVSARYLNEIIYSKI